eukprot:gnl/Spiro4/29220_TR14290_c0_g1_i1.p1 gnl/Spiro4/29220_TR14290_c0_g1~~gnl/Spiro4/29220_TR14290_c0_g1_i1.p1  ORF type:complete len:533 (-),score=123.66 gnl/Spiro4/29220_TR14290_c0_g1_i1:115-1713(-)
MNARFFVVLLFFFFFQFSTGTLPPHPHLFEISTRPWLYSLSQKYGSDISTLAAIPDEELQNIKQRGAHIVWFMGVWELGDYSLNIARTDSDLLAEYARVLPDWTEDDVIGSPYAVVKYSCNPQLGSDADIASLRDRLHALDLLLMLDFVPNHAAVESPLLAQSLDNFVRATKGTSPPYDPSTTYTNGVMFGGFAGSAPWRDTLQLNYWNPSLVKQRIAELQHVASLADAVRCDMAFLLLNDQISTNWGSQLGSWGWSRPRAEFWTTAIGSTKQQFGTLFLAEVYAPLQPALLNVGFDFVYDKTLYDRLGVGNLDGIRAYITSSASALSGSFLARGAHFVQNHDEPSAAAFFGSWWRADTAAQLTMTLPGLRFFDVRQFDGSSARLLVQLRRATAEEPVADVVAMYDKLLAITADDVFHNGVWTYASVAPGNDAWRLVAWKWSLGSERRLCVINYSDGNAAASVVLSDVEGDDSVAIEELVSGTQTSVSASVLRSTGLPFTINQWWREAISSIREGQSQASQHHAGDSLVVWL